MKPFSSLHQLLMTATWANRVGEGLGLFYAQMIRLCLEDIFQVSSTVRTLHCLILSLKSLQLFPSLTTIDLMKHQLEYLLRFLHRAHLPSNVMNSSRSGVKSLIDM